MLYQISFLNQYGETLSDELYYHSLLDAESRAKLLRSLGFAKVQVIGITL